MTAQPVDDDDLFADEIDDDDIDMEPGHDEQTQGDTQNLPAQTQAAGADEGDMDSLFGDDDAADAGQETSKPAEDDLFGSSDEEGGDPAPVQEGDVDEGDLFGLDSDQEGGNEGEQVRPKQTVQMKVSTRRPLRRDLNRSILRLPNILAVDPRPFDKDTFNPDSKISFRETVDLENHRYIQLENSENYIRWRFKRDEAGEVVMHEDGRPALESNARYVEWEDGTSNVFIGQECFRVRAREDPVHIYDDRGAMKVFQAVVPNQITVTPLSLQSKTHQKLKDSQINKVKPNSKVQLQLHGPQAEHRRLKALPGGMAQHRKAIQSASRGGGQIGSMIGGMASNAIGDSRKRKNGMTDAQRREDDDNNGVSLKNLKKSFK